MNVVLRCPNCGTTQAAPGEPGECEACHEAQVRYFCTNHEPGIWLSGPTCPQCEARAAASPPPRPRRPAPVSPPERADTSLDLRPQPLWQKLLRAAVLSRTASAPRLPEARGWLMRLILRLVMIGAILIVAAIAAIYWLASSLH